VSCVAKLPKWAIKQAGGINKKAWRLAKARRRKTSTTRRRKTTTKRSPRRRNPKGGNRVSRKKKNINVNLIDLGGGIVLADQFLGPGALDSIMKFQMPNLSGLPARLRKPDTQGQVLKTAVGIVVLKTALRGFAKQVGAIGPVKIRV